VTYGLLKHDVLHSCPSPTILALKKHRRQPRGQAARPHQLTVQESGSAAGEARAAPAYPSPAEHPELFSSRRRQALLIPYFIPPYYDAGRPSKVYQEAFIKTILDYAHKARTTCEGFEVEVSLIPRFAMDRGVLDVFQEALRREAGLQRVVHIVSYPLQGEELGPLRFLHSLPRYVALPCNPFASRAEAAKMFAGISCSFSRTYAELMRAYFYKRNLQSPPSVHPWIQDQAKAMVALAAEVPETCTDPIGEHDPLRGKFCKGGHVDAKFFLLPFTWEAPGQPVLRAEPCRALLRSVLTEVMERYVSALKAQG